MLVEYEHGPACDVDLSADQIVDFSYALTQRPRVVNCGEYGCAGCGFVHRMSGFTKKIALSVEVSADVRFSRVSEPAAPKQCVSKSHCPSCRCVLDAGHAGQCDVHCGNEPAAPKLADVVGPVNWDTAVHADQQARTIITIMSAELDALRMRVSELEGDGR